jgi:hypothetical protein
MSKKSPPTDQMRPYEDNSQQLAQASNQQLQNNRLTQYTPYAQSSYAYDPATGRQAQTTGFSGPLAGVHDSLQQQAAQSMSQPFSFGQFGSMPTGDGARKQAYDAAYGQAASRLDPMWSQREDQTRTRLLNQGLDPSSEAYRNEMSSLGQDRNDAYGSAMNNAFMQSTAAGDSMFRNDMSSRQQGIAEALRQRGMPMEEMGRMQGFLAMPGYNADNSTASSAGQGAALNQAGTQAYNQQMMDMYGIGSSNTADAVSGGIRGIGALASLAAMMSDERAKTNVVRHEAEAMPGVPFASFEYKHQPGVTHQGVIAQDLEKVAPEYVHEIDGVKFVDYSFLKRGGK